MQEFGQAGPMWCEIWEPRCDTDSTPCFAKRNPCLPVSFSFAQAILVGISWCLVFSRIAFPNVTSPKTCHTGRPKRHTNNANFSPWRKLSGISFGVCTSELVTVVPTPPHPVYRVRAASSLISALVEINMHSSHPL